MHDKFVAKMVVNFDANFDHTAVCTPSPPSKSEIEWYHHWTLAPKTSCGAKKRFGANKQIGATKLFGANNTFGANKCFGAKKVFGAKKCFVMDKFLLL